MQPQEKIHPKKQILSSPGISSDRKKKKKIKTKGCLFVFVCLFFLNASHLLLNLNEHVG